MQAMNGSAMNMIKYRTHIGNGINRQNSATNQTFKLLGTFWKRCCSNDTKVSSQPTTENEEKPVKYRGKDYIRFKDLHRMRKREARNSVLVQMKNLSNSSKMLQDCESYGKIKKCIQINIGTDEFSEKKPLMLVEYKNHQSVLDMLKDVRFFPKEQDKIAMPTKSRLLYYIKWPRRDNRKKYQGKWSRVEHLTDCDIVMRRLQSASTLSGQIKGLFGAQQMTEYGSRLRYMMCSLLEDQLAPLLGTCEITPFGSSVNGFGRRDCDLDMYLTQEQVSGVLYQDEDTFNFKTKIMDIDRLYHQELLDLISRVISTCMPSCFDVHRILNARTPIVKFHHRDTNLYCDLSSCRDNSASLMAELFYVMGEIDQCVRPLMFAVRHLARVCGITRENPGAWITNYQLTLLVLYFLQNSQHILPSLKEMKRLADPGDTHVIESEKITFLREIRKLPKKENVPELGDLLLSFLLFYAEFDFEKQGLSLFHAHTIKKPADTPLYLQNPLHHDINTSQNVSKEELHNFQIHCRNSLKYLEENKQEGLAGLFRKIAVKRSQLESVDIKSILGNPKRAPPAEEDNEVDYQGVEVKV